MAVPEGKKCCVGIPSYCGLNTWGYIKMAFMPLMLTAMILHLINAVAEPSWDDHVVFIVFLTFFILLLTMDICFTVVLVFGRHLKTAKPLHIYFIYCIVSLVIFLLMLLYCIGRSLNVISMYAIGQSLSLFIKYLPNDHSLDDHMHNLSLLVLCDFVLGIFYFGIQICLIIVTRFEVKKLRNNSSCSYINLNADGGPNEDGTDDNRF